MPVDKAALGAFEVDYLSVRMDVLSPKTTMRMMFESGNGAGLAGTAAAVAAATDAVEPAVATAAAVDVPSATAAGGAPAPLASGGPAVA